MHDWAVLTWLERDVRHAWRRLRSAPAFALFGVVTLALSIGATTALYAAVEEVFRPPYMRDVGRVVNIYHSRPYAATGPMWWLSWPDYQDLKAAQTHLERLTAWTRFRGPVRGGARTEDLRGEAVEGDYFLLVGVRPVIGRLLQPADDRPDASLAAVISYAFWQTWFGGDPAIVGETLRIGGHAFEIVGVVEPDFRGVDTPKVAPTPIWISLAAADRLDPSLAEDIQHRDSRRFWVKGRMKPGRSLDEVRAEIAAIASRLDNAAPIGRETAGGPAAAIYQTSRPWFVMPAADVRLSENAEFLVMPVAVAVMGAVVLVLLVSCTNLANLVLARLAGRRHDTAIHIALGASRAQLIRAHLVEGAIVGVGAGLAAVVLARALLLVLGRPIRIERTLVQLEPRLDLSVLAVAGGVTLLTLAVFSVIPAWLSTRPPVRTAMSGGGGVTVRWRTRTGLIAAQVMVSTILVALAFLCARHVRAAGDYDVGMDLDRFAAARIDFESSGYDESRARAFAEEALRAMRLRPGVERAALASHVPLGPDADLASILPRDTPSGERHRTRIILATDDLFTTLGIDIVHGRGFNERDGAGSPPVAVISEGVARRMFGMVVPLGRQLDVQRRAVAGRPQPPVTTVTIVGVAASQSTEALGRVGGGEHIFRPWTQEYIPSVTLVARTAGDPAALLEPLRSLVAGLDPDVAVLDAATGRTLAGAEQLTARIAGVLAALLGGLALVLSLVGLAGLLSCMVAERTREIGVRMALGAHPRRVLGLIVWQGLAPVLRGLITGLALWIAAGLLLTRYLPYRALSSVLPSFDPSVLLLVPATLVLAALVACALPARRAARVDPVVALRQE